MEMADVMTADNTADDNTFLRGFFDSEGCARKERWLSTTPT
ncbi:MAG: hypothetical protein QXI19_01830 [Candidatus Caldarchaeum sp.]